MNINDELLPYKDVIAKVIYDVSFTGHILYSVYTNMSEYYL